MLGSYITYGEYTSKLTQITGITHYFYIAKLCNILDTDDVQIV